MIDLLLSHDGTPADDPGLIAALAAHTERVLASAHGADRFVLDRAETEVSADPAGRIVWSPTGHATVHACGQSWAGGRFEVPTLAELRERAVVRAKGASPGAPCRLWVLDGEGPATDIGALQATAPDGVVFQVASQFNTLEATGPRVVPVRRYPSDPTQGPRAAVSAFPGTLVRHYAAPAPDGTRLTQSTDGPQIELLGDVLPPSVARVDNGYLCTQGIADDGAFAEALCAGFDQIRVGVHDGVEVVLGFNWDGAVEGPRRIAQVLTSTLAGGSYSDRSLSTGPLTTGCRQLLRGAYLGTLLAAAALGHRAVVLTLIGGGVFANPPALLWEAILWAVQEVDHLAPCGLEVIVNGRTLSRMLPADDILGVTRAHGGAVIVLGRASYGGPPPAPRIVR